MTATSSSEAAELKRLREENEGLKLQVAELRKKVAAEKQQVTMISGEGFPNDDYSKTVRISHPACARSRVLLCVCRRSLL